MQTKMKQLRQPLREPPPDGRAAKVRDHVFADVLWAVSYTGACECTMFMATPKVHSRHKGKSAQGLKIAIDSSSSHMLGVLVAPDLDLRPILSKAPSMLQTLLTGHAVEKAQCAAAFIYSLGTRDAKEALA